MTVAARQHTINFSDTELKRRALFLKFTDNDAEDGAPYKVFLDCADSHFVDEAPESYRLKVASVKFQNKVSLGSAIEAMTSGWLYLFVNGRLWREIEVQGPSRYADVNLTRYEGLPEGERPARCEPKMDVVIPVENEGRDFYVQAAYSEQQWSWTRIEALGGIDCKESRSDSVAPNEARDTRCTWLDYKAQASEDDVADCKASPLEAFTVEQLEGECTYLRFSVPSWLDIARHITYQHNACIQSIDSLADAITSRDGLSEEQWYETQLALQLNDQYCFGPAKRNATSGFYAMRSPELDAQRTEQTRRLNLGHEWLDKTKLAHTLCSHRFFKLVSASIEAKKDFIDVLNRDEFLAAMQDYASLGSDQAPHNRTFGLAVLADLFGGILECGMTMASPFLVDFHEHGRLLNPLKPYLTALLGVEGECKLYDVAFNFERLYPEQWQQFQAQQEAFNTNHENPEALSFEERYAPENIGLFDLLLENKTGIDVQKFLSKLFSMFAGFAAVFEADLSKIALQNAPENVQARVAVTDDYDEVIRRYQGDVDELNERIESSESEIEKRKQLGEKSDIALDQARRELAATEAELTARQQRYNSSKPNKNQLAILEDLEATVSLQRMEVRQLEASRRQNLDMQQHLKAEIHDINTTLRQKQTRIAETQQIRAQQLTSPSAHTAKKSELSSTERMHLRASEYSHFVGGSKVVQVRMDLDDLLNGVLPPHLIAINEQQLEQTKQRVRDARAALKNNSRAHHTVTALGIDMHVPHGAMLGNKALVEAELNGIAAAMLDQQHSTPKQYVDIYCYKADVDIALSKTQWHAYKQVQHNTEAYQAYYEAEQAFKRQTHTVEQQQLHVQQQRQRLAAIVAERDALSRTVDTYSTERLRLIQHDRTIHNFQGPLHGAVLAFELFNFVRLWQTYANTPGWQKYWYIGSSFVEITGSVVDVLEAIFRSANATSKWNFHNFEKSTQRAFKLGGRSFGLAGGVIGIVSGYLDIAHAKAYNDSLRLLGSGLVIAGGVLQILAIATGMLAGVVSAPGLVAFALVLGITGLLSSLAAAMLSFYYKTPEETYLRYCVFGKNYEKYAGTPGLENWHSAKACLQALASYLRAPQFQFKVRHREQALSIEIGMAQLQQHHDVKVDIDVRAGSRTGNPHEGWEPLYTEAVRAWSHPMAHAQAQAERTPIPRTYGVDHYRLALLMRPQQSNGSVVFTVPAELGKAFYEAHGNTQPEFRVRVRAQAKTSAPAVLAGGSLPVPFHVSNFDATTSQTITRIEQTHLYEASIEQWYYVHHFEYDLKDYLLSSINGAL